MSHSQMYPEKKSDPTPSISDLAKELHMEIMVDALRESLSESGQAARDIDALKKHREVKGNSAAEAYNIINRLMKATKHLKEIAKTNQITDEQWAFLTKYATEEEFEFSKPNVKQAFKQLLSAIPRPEGAPGGPIFPKT